MPGKNYSF